ncbi:hypothetical protein Nepgr_003541 [Nepenthes gracilis]|uniref:Uncharacterized protein n=1 Tax=Nepenthes gracilis TaxID=150966 RepID=A0AAD3RZS7_NEPGR|nr:hypothetical protein Nepgr_003541 [Nepenthes gracilis]
MRVPYLTRLPRGGQEKQEQGEESDDVEQSRLTARATRRATRDNKKKVFSFNMLSILKISRNVPTFRNKILPSTRIVPKLDLVPLAEGSTCLVLI